ncbi:hypothetical protein BMON_1146 [Bifidobacterium mongoliense DSM 21395]|uniref:Uncharacterized protein n=1 Tax=Bifidobacterium mongoliense DSM 21395 TaxID=1437603 RepID=A0A087BZU9_9BIFI|nr:hypothetical protein BMON_1146 [Bifidobacterium mongoliense DSM 21395]
MRCAECGARIPDAARHGKPQKYCSSKCRLRAWRREKKAQDETPAKRPPKTTESRKRRTAHHEPCKKNTVQTEPESEPYDVLLKRTQHRLQTAMFDPRTPSTSLSALSKQLLTVTKELESLTGDDGTPETVSLTEVVDDAFDPETI